MHLTSLICYNQININLKSVRYKHHFNNIVLVLTFAHLYLFIF